ncbi:unnamed protein product, partial [Ectocarpus sp. 8 AP-2014]
MPGNPGRSISESVIRCHHTTFLLQLRLTRLYEGLDRPSFAMDATPRFRLFDNRRGSSINQMDEEAGRQTTTTLPRRRTLITSSVAVARQRRRNRRRPGARRGLAALVPRLLASSVSSRASRRRALLLLLVLAACGAGVLASARLLAWASLSYSSWPSSSSLPGYLHYSGAGSADKDDDDGNDDNDDADRHKHRRPAVSIGPDAIPSVLLVERGPSGLPSGPALPGGARKANSLVDA